MRREPALAALLGLVAAVSSPGSAAQGPETPAPSSPAAHLEAPHRPRIGLALAGGGAKGAAHIGVLQTLEELNVPIDFIAGTSMGAIIGGLYASGMSADELRDTILAVDWDDALTDEPARRHLSFRRKEEERRYRIDLDAGLRRGRIRFPSGLRSGQKLGFLLQRLTLGSSAISDFDELPIPFRAVATDIHTGDPVVLDHGSLPTALRASMAIPGVFTAVELEGRTLVDGGISNNVPVDVVRAMGADVVIAVDLRLPEPEEIESYVQIAGQLTTLLTQKNMEARLEQADIVIHPEIEGYTTLGFDKVGELVELGRVEAGRSSAELLPLAIPAEPYALHRAAQRRAAPPPPVVASVRFAGNQRVDERVLRPLVRVEPGETLDYLELDRSLLEIYGLGYFQQVSFTLEAETTGGGAVLVIHVLEKPWGPNYLKAGLTTSTGVEAGEGQVDLLLNLTSAPLNRRGAELRTDLILGAQQLLASELYQPLGFRRRWFVAPRAGLRRHDLGFFEDGQEVAVLDVRSAGIAADLGRQLGSSAEARLGLFGEWVNLNVDTGGVEIPDDKATNAGIAAKWTLDRLDTAGIPRDGTAADLRASRTLDLLGSDDEHTRIDLALGVWQQLGRGIGFATLQGGLSPGGDLPVYAQFEVGGLFSLSGFDDRELLGNEYGVARLGYYHHLLSRKALFAGGWLEAGNVWTSEDELGEDTIGAATAALLYDWTFGPVVLAYGRTDTGDDKVYLAVGRSF